MKKAAKVAYYGWYKEKGEYLVDGGILDDAWAIPTRKMYVFTQQYLWEVLDQSHATFLDSGLQDEYVNFKNNIENQINNMKKRPSFDGTQIEIQAGETKIVTDSNNVLQNYNTINQTKDGIKFEHTAGENTLKITVPKECTLTTLNVSDTTFEEWGMIKSGSEEHDTTMYFTFDEGIQNQLYALNYNDPVSLSLSLKIESKGKLELKKLDENGSLIDGAVFTVTGPNGFNQDVTVSGGKIVLENLDKGTYTVKEKNAPNGYLVDTKSYTVEVKAGQTATQAITDGKPTGEFVLTKYNKDKSEKLVGVKYRIWNDDGYSQEFTTDRNGQIQVTGLKLGTYHYQETEAIFGYLVDNTVYSFDLTYQDQNTKVVSVSVEKTNEEPTGTFTLTKYNEDKSAKISGVKYRIWNDDGYNKEISTDGSGQIQVTGLKLGTYHYQEIQTVYGYLIDDKTYTFTLEYENQNTEVIYGSEEKTNKEPTGEITITKTDIKTGNSDRVDNTSHHGDATLKGAVYTLYAKNDIYNVARTRKYFSKNDAIATYTFNEYGVATVEIINSETSAKISAKSDTVCGLPMGNYYSKETTVPTGYNKDTNIYDYVLAYKDEHTEIIKTRGTVVNDVQKAPFEVIKVSTNSNTTAEIVPNAEFTAILTKYVDFYGSFDEAKRHLEEYADDEYSIFRTGSNGHGVSGLLAYGEYTVNETYTPSPEITTVEEFYVNIDRDSNTPIRELVENDLPFESYIKIQKKDKESGKYVTYSNTTFSLYKLNEESGIWEIQQCKIGNNYYYEWTTNEDGIARTETKMAAGKYKIEEVKIPTGYLQLEEDLIFDVNNRNKTLEYDQDWDAWITVTAENSQPKGKLELEKTVKLRENVDKTLINDIDYTKISFGLFANKDIIDYADGSIIYAKGKRIGQYNLKNDGTLTIDNLPMGEYYLQELTTIDGAVLDANKYAVIFEQQDTTTKEYTVNLNIENETTLIEISKQDITGEKELIGATLKIIDENNEVIDSWISTEQTHKIEGLLTGKYYTLIEETAPNGYVKATEIKFLIDNTGEVQKQKMIDKVVSILKTDVDGNILEGAKLTVIDKSGQIVDSWISNGKAHNVSGLAEGESYVLREEYAPNGYVISKEVEFEVSYEKETQEIVLKDKLIEMQKIDVDGNIIEGATIQVFDKEGNKVDEWITEKEPHKIENLIEGKNYILHEEKVPKGYVKAKDVEFTVTEEKVNQEVVMIDKVVEMQKVDVDGNVIEGVTMQVFDNDGNKVDEWITEKEPHKIENLIEGKDYILHEEIVVEGYVKAKDIEFTVTEEKVNQEVVMKDKIVEMTKVDVAGKEIEGATIQVFDKENNLVDEWISEKEAHKIKNLVEGETYILHEEIASEGYVKATDISFEVTEEKKNQNIVMVDKIVEMTKADIAGEEIEGATIQVFDKDGNKVDEWVSEKEAHKIKNLVEGETYILHEEIASEGYVKATDISFEVTEEKINQKITMIDKIVELQKVDVDGNAINGATIQVLDKEGNIVDEWVTEEEPHRIKNLIEGQTYIVHEENVPEGYVKTKDIEITVTDKKENQYEVMIDKIVSISKKDLVTGEELPGAELEITDKDGNVIDKWTSTDTPHNIVGLEEDQEYTLTEKTCPYGYEQAESITFKVTEEKINQLIEMKDMPILKNIKVIKADYDTKEIIKEDFIFGIFEDLECTKLIKEVKSDKESATVTFEDLRYGEYYIKELKAPKNYLLSDKVVKIEINDSGTFADGELLEDNDSVCTFTYFDKVIPKIQTGNETNYILLASSIVISLIGIGIGIIILKRKKNINN